MFFDRLTDLDFSLVTSEEVGIMLIGYLVVFLVLSTLYVVFQNIPRILRLSVKTKNYLQSSKKTLIEAAEHTVGKHGPEKDVAEKKSGEPLSGELNAAISAAIHLYAGENYHDKESTVLTIEQVSKRYSPWSSKIYSVTNIRR